MRALLVVMSLGLVACQRERTSDIDPFLLEQTSIDRTVFSRNLEPNIMLLVDNSSALGDVNDASSRASQLKAAAHALLTNGSTFRWGLTTFPSPSNIIALPPLDDDDSPAPLAANANAINDAIQALTPSGTADPLAALQFTGALPSLNADDDNRADVIVLFTGTAPSEGTTESVQSLYADHQIATAVVAIDPDPSALVAFNDLARAGRMSRRCVYDSSECGSGQTCDANGFCSQSFWSAANVADEFIASQRAFITTWPEDPCLIQLGAAPSNPEYVSVVVNGVTLEAGIDTYRIEGALVMLTGTTCDSVHRATAKHPASIHVRAVEKR